jgi:hypothetical protein
LRDSSKAAVENTAKEGDKRGRYSDKIGMNYLYDMNEPDDTDEYDMQV